MKFSDFVYFGWQIGRMHLQPAYRVPLSIYIVLTNRCNNRCVYCRTHNLPQDDIWTTESLKRTINEMKACGARRIQLTGGEPMVRSDIGEIIAYAKKLGFFVGMSTNGYQVAERIKELKGIDVVFLSYDGPPKVHARLRGENNVGEIKSALLALKTAGICVWTTTVLTKWNVDFIEEIVQFAKQQCILANFNRLEFFLKPPAYLHPLADEVQDLILGEDKQKRAFQKLIQLKSSGAPIGSSFEYLKSVVEWPHADKVTDSKLSKRYRCWAGRAYGHLDADGMLYSCGWAALWKLPGLDVLKEGFQSSWKKLKPISNCKSCSHACGVENNLIFSLNFSSIANAFTNLR